MSAVSARGDAAGRGAAPLMALPPSAGSAGPAVFCPPRPQAEPISPATARNETKAKRNFLRMLTRAPPSLGCTLDEAGWRDVPARIRRLSAEVELAGRAAGLCSGRSELPRVPQPTRRPPGAGPAL